MLSNAGLCWQPGQWKRLLDMEEARRWEAKSLGEMGSESCIFLCVSQRWWEKVESEKTPGGFPDSKAKTMATNTQEPGTLDLSWVLT